MTASTVAPLQELEADLPEGMEFVDGKLIEKTGMTLKHSSAQAALAAEWRSYGFSSGQGGKAYTEATCQTDKQKRRPDVAYLTAELLQQFGEPAMFPQSFPLVAEVASPDDRAETLFAKAREYLRSGCQEVWLLFPETLLVMIVTPQKWLVFAGAETATTQVILQGFSISVKVLFA